MMVLIGLAAVGISTLLLCCVLGFIWWLDRYEREPLWLVIIAFLWGGFGGTILGCVVNTMVGTTALLFLSEQGASLLTTVVVAPVVEEFTKGLIFVALLLVPLFRGELDNETDGLIYGAATGLGFAVIENLFYFANVALSSPSDFFAVVVMRTLFTALVHTISSSLLGYSIGYIRYRRLVPFLWIVPFLGYGLAVANHAWWNLAAMLSGAGFLSPEAANNTFGLAILSVIGMSFFMFLLTQLSLHREKRIIVRYLLEEASVGSLPREHVGHIASWRQRGRPGWLSAAIPRSEYVQAATLLAFRRYQAATVAPRYRAKYEQQAQHYRDQIATLLGHRW